MSKVPAKVELYYSGAWHDITATDDVYTRDPITITRGRGDQVSRIPPSTLNLTIENRDGKYSPRNPMSPLYGLIGRNTPIRVSVGTDIRFVGEVESWPQRWNTKGNDVWAPITANGILRRINAPGTTKPSHSPLRRTLSTSTYAGLLGWWPMEDVSPDSLSVPSFVSGGTDITITETAVTRSLDDTLPGSSSLPRSTIGVGASFGTTLFGGIEKFSSVPLLSSSGSNNCWSMGFWFNTRLLEDHPTTTGIIVQVFITGSAQIDRWSFFITNSNLTTDIITLNVMAISSTGSAVTGLSPAAVDVTYTDGEAGWHFFRFNADVTGGNQRMRVYLDEVLQISATESAGKTVGQPYLTNIRNNVFDSNVPMSFGHLMFAGGTSGSDLIDDNATALFSAGKAYVGDTATDRMDRLCTEEGITLTLVDAGDTELVGVQKVAPFLDLVYDAADADGGILYETRNSLGLSYRTHVGLYNVASALNLSYSAGGEVAPTLNPVEDTDATGNDITVTRYKGGSATSVKETGTLNVQEPSDDPDGVGRYERDYTLVLFQDEQCLQQAAWLRHLGTWDEARYPVINMDLTAMAADGKSSLATSALSLDVGDRLTINSPLATAGSPDSIVQHAQGFTETIESHHHMIAVNATPALPYDVLRLETDTTSNLSRIPASLTGTIVSEAEFSIGETSLDITSTTARWIDSATYPAQFPFDIMIGGERMTVTALVNTGLAQTLTITRSINGVSKAHVNGTPVQLFRPPVIAR